MKKSKKPKTPHIGNMTVILSADTPDAVEQVLLLRKRPETPADRKRRRKKVGCGCWVPPGGGAKPSDASQKHGARREVLEETGLRIPLGSFHKVAILKGYIGKGKSLLWIVHVYVARVRPELKSRVVASPEYDARKWFSHSRLPFAEMMEGDRKWLPQIMSGEKLKIEVTFEENTENLVGLEITPMVSCK